MRKPGNIYEHYDGTVTNGKQYPVKARICQHGHLVHKQDDGWYHSVDGAKCSTKIYQTYVMHRDTNVSKVLDEQ